MSKYQPLWAAVSEQREESVQLTFAEIGEILGFPIDHAFLNFKKELTTYGWQVDKISMKAQTVKFSRCAAAAPEYSASDTLFFFDGRPDALALYEKLCRQLAAELPGFTRRVHKSQIGFYNHHLFAMVSLPRRKSERGLVVSFGLDHRLSEPRISVATEPYPNRWTHHVPVTEESQLDEELLGWLREAYEFADSKLR